MKSSSKIALIVLLSVLASLALIVAGGYYFMTQINPFAVEQKQLDQKAKDTPKLSKEELIEFAKKYQNKLEAFERKGDEANFIQSFTFEWDKTVQSSTHSSNGLVTVYGYVNDDPKYAFSIDLVGPNYNSDIEFGEKPGDTLGGWDSGDLSKLTSPEDFE